MGRRRDNRALPGLRRNGCGLAILGVFVAAYMLLVWWIIGW